jgi:hypothetical protein
VDKAWAILPSLVTLHLIKSLPSYVNSLLHIVNSGGSLLQIGKPSGFPTTRIMAVSRFIKKVLVNKRNH